MIASKDNNNKKNNNRVHECKQLIKMKEMPTHFSTADNQVSKINLTVP